MNSIRKLGKPVRKRKKREVDKESGNIWRRRRLQAGILRGQIFTPQSPTAGPHGGDRTEFPAFTLSPDYQMCADQVLV